MPGLEYNQVISKVFDDEEQGYRFYNNYAKGKGFSVRRDYCEWDIGHNERTLRHFVCSCEDTSPLSTIKFVAPHI